MLIVMNVGCVKAGAQVVAGDFNGDHRDDLAVGIPLEDIGAFADAGAVQVLYGRSVGLRVLNSQFWTQDEAGVPGDAAANDRFGAALAAGDFDKDGFDDLAIGVPGEWVGIMQSVGAITILYGSAAGLTADVNDLLHRSSPGVSGTIEAFVNFGASLASADFNGDGFDDLVIGVVNDTVTAHDEAGSIHVLYGSALGLTPSGDRILHQDEAGVAESAETADNFGAALATGDFDRDGFDDVAVAVPSERLPGAARAGAVHVLCGSITGLETARSQLWHENSPGIPDVAQANDRFGHALSVGDFDDDRYDDLAIGVPGQDLDGVSSAGLVHVLYGSPNGLTASRDQVWDQAAPAIGDAADEFSSFGRALAAGDFDDDGFDDLAIGAPGAAVNGEPDAGVVFVLYGSPAGLRGNGHQRWDQDAAGVGSPAEAGARFGECLGAGDFDRDRAFDLAISLPQQDVNAFADAGAITVLYGAKSALSAAGSQWWHQDQPGVADACEQSDNFGGPAVE
jgi:hypothetical protein